MRTSTAFDNRFGAVGRYELTKRAHRSALLAFPTQSSARYEFFSSLRECRPSVLYRPPTVASTWCLHAIGMVEERPMGWLICKRHFAISARHGRCILLLELINQMKAANE